MASRSVTFDLPARELRALVSPARQDPHAPPIAMPAGLPIVQKIDPIPHVFDPRVVSNRERRTGELHFEAVLCCRCPGVLGSLNTLRSIIVLTGIWYRPGGYSVLASGLNTLLSPPPSL